MAGTENTVHRIPESLQWRLAWQSKEERDSRLGQRADRDSQQEGTDIRQRQAARRNKELKKTESAGNRPVNLQKLKAEMNKKQANRENRKGQRTVRTESRQRLNAEKSSKQEVPESRQGTGNGGSRGKEGTGSIQKQEADRNSEHKRI